MAKKKGGGGGSRRRRGGGGGGTVAQRTANPQNAAEAKEACKKEVKNVILSYVQNDLFPEMGLARENVRLAFGFSGQDTLKDFFKQQKDNFTKRTLTTETETENENYDFMEPSAKSVTKLQDYPKQSLEKVIED